MQGEAGAFDGAGGQHYMASRSGWQKPALPGYIDFDGMDRAAGGMKFGDMCPGHQEQPAVGIGASRGA
ncbi:hypothetical protein [Arthrobacter sp. OV608]|uniref:hypothetical protein n=1 Tax=Arthrobacter sp. OV608 TaxID=1882768 RepID=UPI0008C4DD76|nr:hypothetical protein [Arthrobacter sp. OV608]SEQ79467.1 hypothetical protein SAMN05444745_11129 [Arthrobacter sp. OV608]